MHQEGAIVLGTGGDNSNASVGSFFEGVMTSGFPTDAADNAVQANIVAAGYSGNSDGPPATAGTIGGPGGQCVDVIGDDIGTDGAVVDLWNCQSYAIDQHWTHNSDDSLSTLGRCLDIDGDGTAVGTKVELWDCNGVGGQKWVQQSNGSLLNPQSGLCLDDPERQHRQRHRAADLHLQRHRGAGVLGQRRRHDRRARRASASTSRAMTPAWRARSCSSGAASPTPSTSTGTTTPTARWRPSGCCLDIDGDGTAVGTKVEVWTCNGVGGQVWQQQSNGSLLNPQSGLCLDDPSDNTADGTQLQIYTCNGTAAQQFALS